MEAFWHTKDGKMIAVTDMDTKHLISAFLLTSKIDRDRYNPEQEYTLPFNAPEWARLSWKVAASPMYWELFYELRERGKI